jgi:hypothetical protein
MLEALSELYDPAPQPDLASRLLALLTSAVSADSVSYTSFDSAGAAVTWQVSPAQTGAFSGSGELFRSLVHQHPVLGYQRRTSDGRAWRISDFLSDRQFRALGLYQDFYRPTGVRYQLAATVPDASGGLIGLALNRRGRDFADHDRWLVNVLRPHVRQAHAVHTLLTAALPAGPATDHGDELLTRRQRQILQLVADGHTDRAIGRLLRISSRTVETHLACLPRPRRRLPHRSARPTPNHHGPGHLTSRNEPVEAVRRGVMERFGSWARIRPRRKAGVTRARSALPASIRLRIPSVSTAICARSPPCC